MELTFKISPEFAQTIIDSKILRSKEVAEQYNIKELKKYIRYVKNCIKRDKNPTIWGSTLEHYNNKLQSLTK